MELFPTTLLLALLPGVGALLGGLLAEGWEASEAVLNRALHLAAGVVVGIVSVELMPRALDSLGGGWIALSFGAGGLAYMGLDKLVDVLRGDPEAEDEEASRMWMIYAAVAIDLTSDGLMIGAGTAVAPSLGFALGVGQVLANLPGGYATGANFRDKGLSRRRRLTLSTLLVAFPIVATLASYALLQGASDELKGAALVFVAALLVLAALEDMLREAHQTSQDGVGSVLALVGGVALLVVLSTALGEEARQESQEATSEATAGVEDP